MVPSVVSGPFPRALWFVHFTSWSHFMARRANELSSFLEPLGPRFYPPLPTSLFKNDTWNYLFLLRLLKLWLVSRQRILSTVESQILGECWPCDFWDFRIADDLQSLGCCISKTRLIILNWILLKYKDLIGTNPCFIKTSGINCA